MSNELPQYKNTINGSIMRPIARELIEKYPTSIGHLEKRLDNILFIQVQSIVPAEEKKITPVDIFKAVKVATVPLQMAEVIHQESKHTYIWKIEFKSWLYELYGRNVIVALLYHCLRCIAPDGKIISPDRCGWSELMENLGNDWYDPNSSSCENILEEDILNRR